MKLPERDKGVGDQWVLRTGWVLDGTGKPVKRDQQIAVTSGRIRSIVPAGDAALTPTGLVDLPDCTVLPALVDAHVHLTFSGTLDPKARQSQLQQSTGEARDAIEKHLQDAFHHGVLAVRHGGDTRGDLLRYMRAQTTPIAVKATGYAWHAHGRYGRMIGRAMTDDADVAEALDHAPKRPDHIKILNSGINSLDQFGRETPPQFSKERLARICRHARDKHLPVMVHANGEAAVKESIEAGCRSIEHGYFMGKDNLQRMAEHGVAWVPTAVPMAALAQKGLVSPARSDVARRTLDHQLEQIAGAQAAGVEIVLGTDAGSLGVDHGKGVGQELGLLVRAGLSVPRAIQCATVNAARLLGLAGRGTLEEDSRADLIIVDGGPDDLPGSLNKILAVVCAGRWHNTLQS